MSERLTESQERVALHSSRQFEQAWRSWFRPRQHSLQEVEDACKFLIEEKKKFELLIEFNKDTIYAEILNRVFMGVYHHDIGVPPELKYKPVHRN